MEVVRKLTARPAIPKENKEKCHEEVMRSAISDKKEGKQAVTVISSTKATSDNDGQLGNVRTRDRADHFGAVLGDPTFFCFRTDHVPGDVYEKE